MRHPGYCRTHHPGISTSITNVTHFSTPPTSTMLAHRPLYSRWYTSMLPMLACNPTKPPTKPNQHITCARTSPTLALCQRKHNTHVSTPSTQARHPRHSQQNKQHIISQTPGYPIKFLKLLGLKFQEQIQQVLLLLFIFTVFTLKLNLFRGIQSALFKRRPFFSKVNAQLFQKKLFLNISVVLTILLSNSLLKINYLYH